MLQKVRWRLTLINISVIGGILMIFSLAIFLGSPRNEAVIMNRLWQVAENDGPLDTEHGFLKRADRNEDLVYVKMDIAGKITEQSFSDQYSIEQTRTMIQTAANSGEYSGKLQMSNHNIFYFLKVNLDKEQGTVWVMEKESGGLSSFLLESIPLILLILLLVFMGSLFISGKALIPVTKAWEKQINFTADASHELRTPLAVIQTNLEIVLGNSNESVESQRKWLDHIMIENTRLTNLVNDLLTLSRADSSEHTLSKNLMLLDTVLLEAIIPFESQAMSKGIDLLYDLEPEIYFWGDSNRLKQLIVILIDNALQYTNRSGRIHVHLIKKDKGVELSVSDTGVGIAEEHMDKIFDRFYRGDKARVRNGGGSGLGLAIAKWIVEEHNGFIRVKSILGEGSVFSVHLPIVES
ncbi:signal transduction histidine kinase [Fontibacillus solani]|uniref:histidine kinase n=1 Tax=Fontibacillus solani TaxID=1572857 RepID=A0A7W3XQV0_9BACL|nr:HAMP domain-containing sensor histidine kinase [Fontibacillus solani]MBA9084874.1 signal transduction histidine kinase [Fontibacillus solani]